MKYRIKIVENEKGELKYIPQVKKSIFSKWYNVLFKKTLQNTYHYYHSNDFEFSFNDENQAMNVVNSHKQYVNKETEIVKTSYKNL